MPQPAADGFKARGAELAAGRAHQPAIGDLSATARVERRLRQQARPGLRIDDLGLDDQRIGMLVIERARHAPGSVLKNPQSMPRRRVAVLVKNEVYGTPNIDTQARTARANCSGVTPKQRLK